MTKLSFSFTIDEDKLYKILYIISDGEEFEFESDYYLTNDNVIIRIDVVNISDLQLTSDYDNILTVFANKEFYDNYLKSNNNIIEERGKILDCDEYELYRIINLTNRDIKYSYGYLKEGFKKHAIINVFESLYLEMCGVLRCNLKYLDSFTSLTHNRVVRKKPNNF